jgi:hypothetical protein
MSVVRFAMLCDKCGRRSEEYGCHATCRECGLDICEACDVKAERTEDERNMTLCRDCQRAEWERNQAQAIAEVEADRAEQIERIMDYHCPGSRRAALEDAKNLAAGIEHRLAGSVSSVFENDFESKGE